MLGVLATISAEADRREDRRLAQAAGGGAPRAQRDLVRRLTPRVRSLVRYLAGDSGDGPDLVQMGLVEVLRSASSFRGESRLETWADRIVVRTTLRRLRRARRAPEPIDQCVVERMASPESDPAEQVDRDRVRARMAELLGQLLPERRVVMVLHVVLGHSVREIAEITGTKENTVWDRLKVGKRQLRELVLGDELIRRWVDEEEAP